MSHKFIGGVHPNDKKAPTNVMRTEILDPPAQVVIPVSLHIGAPCQPLVAVGDQVCLGQKIADSPAPVSAPIHASVSGKVIAIEPRLHSNGMMVNSIVIENDGLDTLAEFTPCEDDTDPDAIVKAIREAGIVGMGGATFPTAFKISSGKGKVDTVIINGAECEPYITSDHRTMLEHTEDVLLGVKYIMRACGVSEAHFGIEENKADAIEALNQKNTADSGIHIVGLPCRYPQGAEKQLIYSITGKEVPPGGLPAAVGCAVFNSFTAYCVAQAVTKGIPFYERIVTVSGSAVKEPKNLLVRVGTPLDYIFEHCGGFVDTPKKVIMGGPMMGSAMYDLSVGTTKGTNALLAFCADEDRSFEESQCIRCGRCVEACPMRLLPSYLYMYERISDFDAMDRYHIMDCIECGACTYNCPARLHLTHACRTGKAKIQARAAAEKARAEAEARAAEEKARAEAEKSENSSAPNGKEAATL